MAPQFRNRVETESIKRVVCDYIAGMTDRFAEEASLREGSSLPTG
jgi:dGTP triphosphohydrolase